MLWSLVDLDLDLMLDVAGSELRRLWLGLSLASVLGLVRLNESDRRLPRVTSFAPRAPASWLRTRLSSRRGVLGIGVGSGLGGSGRPWESSAMRLVDEEIRLTARLR